MRRFILLIAALFVTLFSLIQFASALAVSTVPQGGTGWARFQTNTLLTGNGTTRLATTSIGTGLSLAGGTLTNTGVTSNAGDWAGTWQTFSPSHFQTTISATYPLVLTGTVLSTPLSTTTLSQTYGTAQGGTLSIATSSDTNILFNVTNTNGAFTFTPAWTGTLADARITSAATWNAKLSAVTADSPLSGSGTSASHLVLSTAGTWSGNAGTATALAANGTNCSAGNYPLGVDASGNSETCTAAASAANPTQTIDLSTHNGSASTYMRSDAAPALSQSIAPTWSSLHIFSAGATSTQLSVTSKAYFGGSGTSTFSSAGILTLVNAANALTIPALGTAAGTFLAADPSGNVIATTTPAGGGGGNPGGTGTELQFRSGASTFGAVPNSAVVNGLVGIGSSTPFAIFSIASSTYNYINPLLAIATSSDSFGQMFQINATSSSSNLISIAASWIESGVREIIGGIGKNFASTGTLDQEYVNGRVYQDWGYASCDSLTLPLAISAQTQNVCGGFSAQAASATGGQFVLSAASTDPGIQYTTMQFNSASGPALGGTALMLGAVNWMIAATSTPVMEVIGRTNSNTSVNGTIALGFMNSVRNAAGISAAPASGCYFTASSTQANWKAVCGNSSTYTITDTGIASSTVIGGVGAFYAFRIQMDNTHADFFIKNTQNGSFSKVATITSNVPSTVALAPMITSGVAVSNTGAARFDFGSVRVWWQRVLPQN